MGEVIDAENNLRCPICLQPLRDMRGIRAHLQSARHGVTNKDLLYKYVVAARTRSRDVAYSGSLAVADSIHPPSRIVRVRIDENKVNMNFGMNADGELVVTRAMSSFPADLRSALKNGKVLTINGNKVEGWQSLRTMGSARPIIFEVLTADCPEGFRTRKARCVQKSSVDEDVYNILGLSREATEAEIREAYRRESLRTHPDKGGGDALAFASVAKAYKILSDPSRRSIYDKRTKSCHPVLMAARTSDLAALRRFSKSEIVKALDRHGSNALHYASGYGASRECLHFLIEDCSFEFDGVSGATRTPLMWAARNGHLDTVVFLVERGADPMKGASDCGTSAIHWSLMNGHLDTAAYLLTLGCDINALNNFSCSAGHFIGLSGSVQAMDFFIRNGGNINFSNNQGHTVIHKAAWRGRMELLVYLRASSSAGFFFENDNNGYSPAGENEANDMLAPNL